MNFKEYLAANLNEGSPYTGLAGKNRAVADNPTLHDGNARNEKDAGELMAAGAAGTPNDQDDRAKLRLSPAEERRAKLRKIAMAKAKRSETFIGRFLRKIGMKD